MEEVSCCNCGGYFIPDPRQKQPKYCRKPACQRARKAAWQREKMRCDRDYQANQKRCQQDWFKANPGYWKRYREEHPEQAERNRVLQRVRNRKRRALAGVGQDIPSADRAVKMDASLIAKMDALKVNIYRITACCE